MAGDDGPYVIEADSLIETLMILIEGYKQNIISKQELIHALLFIIVGLCLYLFVVVL